MEMLHIRISMKWDNFPFGPVSFRLVSTLVHRFKYDELVGKLEETVVFKVVEASESENVALSPIRWVMHQ